MTRVYLYTWNYSIGQLYTHQPKVSKTLDDNLCSNKQAGIKRIYQTQETEVN